MATTATAPKDVLADRKVAGLLDDLVEDTDDAIVTAKALQRSTAMRHCSSTLLSEYGRAITALDKASQSVQYERGAVLDGKAKDLSKFKRLLQTELDGLTNLQEQNGRFEVLQDADLGAVIVAIIAVLHELAAPASEMARLQREVESIRAKLQAAITAARDTKVKAVLNAGLTAATALVPPMGLAVGLSVFAGKIVASEVIDAAIQGREDSKVKELWGWGDKLLGASQAIDVLPRALGPLGDIVSGGVDIGECFAAERDKQALFKQLETFMADFKKAAAAYVKSADAIGEALADAMDTLADAIDAVKAFKPVKGSYHALLKMI